jgi:hypothetical protein
LVLALLAGCGAGVPHASSGKDPSMPNQDNEQQIQTIEAALARGPDATPAMLREYADGRPEPFRRDLYAMYWRTGTRAESAPRRMATVEFLLQQVTGEGDVLRPQILKWLQDFEKDDFNAEARQRLAALPWTPAFAPEAIRLVGIAELSDLVPWLRSLIRDAPLAAPPPAGYHASNTWAALLALARMGDAASLARVIQQVRSEPDIILRASVLFMDLGYTRQSAAFDALRIYLNSNERLPQLKPTAPGRLEAAYAAAAFSKHLRNFPIQETDFNEQQVTQARAWANAQSRWSVP